LQFAKGSNDVVRLELVPEVPFPPTASSRRSLKGIQLGAILALTILSGHGAFRVARLAIVVVQSRKTAAWNTLSTAGEAP
jgi:hypothetical protein